MREAGEQEDGREFQPAVVQPPQGGRLLLLQHLGFVQVQRNVGALEDSTRCSVADLVYRSPSSQQSGDHASAFEHLLGARIAFNDASMNRRD